jgi:hypothetical protein
VNHSVLSEASCPVCNQSSKALHPLDVRKIFSDNVDAIMVHRYGKINMLRMSNDVGLAIATFTRIKDCHTFSTMSTVNAIASSLGYQPWALMLPNFDPANPQTVAFCAKDAETIARIKNLAIDLAIGL